MNDRMFDSPVLVRASDNTIQEIACLEDALEFLYEWPKGRRGAIYDTALRACRRVIESNYPLDAARHAFAGFAKSARILAEPEPALPWMAASKGQGGGLTA